MKGRGGSRLKQMNDLGIHSLVEFLEMSGRLKKIPRTGWIEAGVCQPESVADHTCRTAILCMVHADIEGLDQLKLLRMALIHDLPEAITGDLSPSKETADRRRREDNAINHLLNLLPKKQRQEYMRIWMEYKEGKTKEAKALRQLEKIEMALQAKEYEEEIENHSLKRFIESTKKVIIWPELKRLLSCILEERRQ